MGRSLSIVPFVLALSACGACGGSTETGGAAGADPVADTRVPEPASGSSDERTPTDPADPPAITVTGERTRGGVAIVVQSRGAEPARVRSIVRVERRDGEAWEPVGTGDSLELRAHCDVDPPGCIELVPGAELRAAPWKELVGDSQCACEACGPAEPGEYRFVVESCAPAGHAPHEVASPTFLVGG